MKKGCGLGLLLWIVLSSAYGAVAWWKIRETVPALIVGVLGGTFASILVGGVMGLAQGRRDRAAIERARRGVPRQDGQLEAASGPIHALGETLEGPFTGNSCVAYEYDVKNPTAERSDFAGVALAPCAIDTSTGPVKLLGWAALDDFVGGPKKIDRERAATYLQRTTFEPLALGSVLSTLGSLLADEDGTIRKDFRIGNADVDLEGRTLVEKIVPAGQTVTAIGIWSAEKGGFVSSGAAVNRILPLGPDSARGYLLETARKKLLIAVVFFLGLHGILIPMYLLSGAVPKRDRAGKKIPAHASVFDERDCNRLQDLLAAGADPNEAMLGGRTPLMNAVSNGNIECVKSLVAAGARPDTKDEDGSSAMSWAITAERDDLIAVLKKAGGTDFRVTADSGRSLGPDDEPIQIVKAYCTALQEGDLAEVGRLCRPSTADFIRKENVLSLWQHTRPRSPEFVEGFANDRSATLSISGKTTNSPGGTLFHFQLEKSSDGWHIDKEWFKD